LHTHEVRVVCGTYTGLMIDRCRQVADVRSEVTPLQRHTCVCSILYHGLYSNIICVNNIHQEYKPFYEIIEVYIFFL